MTKPEARPTDARTALAGRVLTMGSADALRAVLADIEESTSGVVILGAKARALARQLRLTHPGMIVMVQPDTHALRPASVDDPFPFVEQTDGMLQLDGFTVSLEDWIAGVVAAGSTFAVLPTGYIDAGAHAEIRAVVERANLVDRGDVVLHLPLNHKWMVRPGDRAKVIAAVRRSRHPVAISLAHQGDPASQRGVVEGIHAVLAAVGDHTGLWFSDLGVFDAIANGGWCGAVGLTSTNRHIVAAPAGTGFSPRLTDRTPNVLLPDYLRWKRAQTMTREWFANGYEPHCDCVVCDGRALTRFTAAAADEAEAHRHNVLALSAIHRALTAAGPARLTVWSDMLAESDAAHTAAATATGVMAIKASDEQKAWARNNPAPTTVP